MTSQADGVTILTGPLELLLDVPFEVGCFSVYSPCKVGCFSVYSPFKDGCFSGIKTKDITKLLDCIKQEKQFLRYLLDSKLSSEIAVGYAELASANIAVKVLYTQKEKMYSQVLLIITQKMHQKFTNSNCFLILNN